MLQHRTFHNWQNVTIAFEMSYDNIMTKCYRDTIPLEMSYDFNSS